MLFKKKSSRTFGRSRQPFAGSSSSAKPVFSYHARSLRSDEAVGGVRRSPKPLWVNPTAPPPKRAPRPSRPVVASLLAIAVIGLGINSLLLSRDPQVVATAQQPFLRPQTTYQMVAREILGSSLLNATKLTINTERAAQLMQDKFPELAHVSVVLPFFGRRPVFYIQPIQPSLLLKTNDARLFILDQSGRAVMDAAQVADLAKLQLPVVEDQSGLPVTLGHTVLPSDNIAFITEVAGQLGAKHLPIAAITLPAGISEADVRLEGSPYLIKFNLHGDARAEVGAYLAVKQQLDSEHKTPNTYIDVRVENKAYYR